MNDQMLRKRVVQLWTDGKDVEALDLLKTELEATKTITSPSGNLKVTDWARKLPALRVGLGLLKQYG